MGFLSVTIYFLNLCFVVFDNILSMCVNESKRRYDKALSNNKICILTSTSVPPDLKLMEVGCHGYKGRQSAIQHLEMSMK